MANIVVQVRGLEDVIQALAELGPALQAQVYPQALRAAAVVIARKARIRDYGFTDGEGVRPFDAAQGLSESVRLRSTIRTVGIPAYYQGRRYLKGRSAVHAGGPGARHAYLVEAGHGGPQPARPHPYLVAALLDTADRQLQAFVQRARARFPLAVARAARRRTGLGASTARTIARRARR